jgi:hypothetical protein
LILFSFPLIFWLWVGVGFQGAKPLGRNFFVKNGKESEPAVVVGRTYDFVLWLLPKVEKFPRSYRFSVGERLVGFGLDLLILLVESAYSADKLRELRAASNKTNGLRYLLRLSKDLRLLSLDSYRFAAERLEEIGRMVGGWQRSAQARR